MAERRRNPKDDLISVLIAAEEEGEKLTEQELLATCVTLLAGGHETTTNLIGNGILALLRPPIRMNVSRIRTPIRPKIASSAGEASSSSCSISPPSPLHQKSIVASVSPQCRIR